MNRKYNYSGGLSAVGLLIALGMARGFDTFISFLQQRNAETFFLPFVILWSYALLTLLLATILLLLFWFVFSRASRNIWIALFYLLIGLFIVSYPTLYFTPIFCCLPPIFETFFLPAQTIMFYSGGFIAIIGLFALILPRGK
jgi:hypothetical protein